MISPTAAAEHGRERVRGDRRLRVLQVINLNVGGGAERFAVGLALYLPRDRFESFVCSPREISGGPEDLLAANGIPLIVLGRQGKLDLHRISGLVKVIHRHRIDVIHAHLFGSNLWATLLGRACNVPVVIAHEHTWSYEGNPLRAFLDGYVIGRLATRFIAVSNADAERMQRIENVPPAKVQVMPTAYVPHVGRPATDLRTELGLPASTPLIASVATMRPQKALDVLVDAHALVVAKVPDAHLVFAGDGECQAEIRRCVRERRLEDRVHFLGKRNDIDSVLKSATVAALSSDFEGTPLIAFECMANDTPLVSTAVGGVPDIIDDGRTGLLVPPRRPDLLAAAIVDLLQDPERAATIAHAAAQGLEPYRIESVARKFGDLYEQLAAAAGVR